MSKRPGGEKTRGGERQRDADLPPVGPRGMGLRDRVGGWSTKRHS